MYWIVMYMRYTDYIVFAFLNSVYCFVFWFSDFLLCCDDGFRWLAFRCLLGVVHIIYLSFSVFYNSKTVGIWFLSIYTADHSLVFYTLNNVYGWIHSSIHQHPRTKNYIIIVYNINNIRQYKPRKVVYVYDVE